MKISPIMIVAVAVSLIAGLAIGAWLATDGPAEETTERPLRTVDAALDERILSLEQLLAEEREARFELTAQVKELVDAIEQNATVQSRGAAEESAANGASEESSVGSMRRSRNFAAMIRNFEERRLQSLMDGGFSEDEARRVLQRESEAEYNAMQLAWETQREGTPLDQLTALNHVQALLRADLGDTDYERFLEAQGQPTSIQITRVLDSSPGSEVGLQPGDQIVSYDGERVFNVNDLRELTLKGAAGEDVVMEIDRDGVRMQLSVPRGPVGITGSGANFRPLNRWGGG